MKLGTKKLGGILSAAALTVGALSLLAAPGCEDTPGAPGITDCLDLTCGEGLATGNFSITGVKSVDAFFKATLDFTATADTLAGGLKAELKGLQADFGITD